MKHWTDKPHEVIEDTCSCGSKIRISAQYPESQHNRWLEAHKVCRTGRPTTTEDKEVK